VAAPGDGAVPLRRGDENAPIAPFEAAWELANAIDEPLRRLAVLSALAERMWMTELTDVRVTDVAVSTLDRLAALPGSGWAAGDLALWLARLGLLEKPPASVAEPFRLALGGRPEEAASWWRRLGDPFAEAMAWG
jgi:hypothetical protein